MKLYTHPLSGHAHRASLFLSLIGADVEEIVVDLAAGEHKTPAFLQLNRFGQVPVLVDGDTVIADSNAILVYAARKHGRTDWLPETPQAPPPSSAGFRLPPDRLPSAPLPRG